MAPAGGASEQRTQQSGAGGGSPVSADRDARESAAPADSGRRGVVLTGQRLFSATALLLVLMPLVYMGGVLAGRWQVERELAAVNPMAVLQKAQSEGSGSAGAEGVGSSTTADSILKPQELTFSRMLRAAPGEKPDLGKIRPFQPAVAPAPKQDADGQPVMAPGMSPAVPSGPPEPPAQEATLFDFVFQIAAFHSTTKAEEMRIRLEAEGFRSRMEKSGRLYIVYLLTRGPKNRVDEVRETLKKMRLGDPIERSRKPVFEPVGVR